MPWNQLGATSAYQSACLSWHCKLCQVLIAVPAQLQSEIYKLYGKAYGWYSLLALCFFWASEQSCNILTSWWLSQWTTAQILYQVRRAAGMTPSSPAPCLASHLVSVLSRSLMACTSYIELLCPAVHTLSCCHTCLGHVYTWCIQATMCVEHQQAVCWSSACTNAALLLQ